MMHNVDCSVFTYELGLCLRLLSDGVPDHPGVHEGEGRDESLGEAGGQGGGLGLGDRGGGGEESQEKEIREAGSESHGGCVRTDSNKVKRRRPFI